MNLTKLTLMLLMLVSLAAFAQALPFNVDSVQVNDVVLIPNSSNRLDVERGQQLDIVVRLIALDSAKNVEIEAFISGFEFNDVERVSDTTGLFDVLQNVTYVKRLSIPLPAALEKDDYKLRIVVSDRDNLEIVQNYALKIDVPRHLVGVEDVLLTPENEIIAGGSLLASVRVENLGAKVEEDVKVKVAIPELGVSATKYISKVGVDDETESEDVYLRLPECAQPGTYAVVATLYYADGHRTSVGKASITVLKNELCYGDDVDAVDALPEKLLISVGSNLESVQLGGSAVFPITVSNNARLSKSFTVAHTGVGWADVSVSPTATAVVMPGKSQTFYVFVAPNDSAVAGANKLDVSVSSSSELLQQVSLTANVLKQSGSGLSIKRVLELGLIVLLVLLIIVGLIVGFILLRDDAQSPPKSEPYY